MHGIRGRYVVRLRKGPRRATFPAAELIDGKVFEFRPGFQITDQLGGYYANEGAMVTCDPDYPDAAPTWLPSGDLHPVDDAPRDLVDQAK